ncbi:helix-turn-helix domain-containing protein [Actinocorallia sp. API 0066]|uniref:helix-turn-helix domain-containing protein n=1 Tax=Actinocorallia sp. API 0066 TaxID=2896846 RepID=UPI001E61D326|nr:helix-turn-helix transcriptional regulator [Actinocorallia sp. API 0066]MCD0448786.1 helix-turn-helix domain-containing protein [Actinocorallia sp. API 0066]
MSAFYLRFFRMHNGHSGDTVAKWLNCSRATVSRMETGDAKLDERHAAILDAKWKLATLFQDLVWYARLGGDPNWAKNYVQFEQIATGVWMYEGQVVPLLLQTEDYMRALVLRGGARDPEKTFSDRRKRQAILDEGGASPFLWVLIAETVLGPHVGGREVMRKQLAHLIELSHRPKIILRVVPNTAGANEGLDGPFKIIAGPRGDVGFIEAKVDGRLVTQVAEVAMLKHQFDLIGSDALSVDSSRRLIGELMEKI